MRRMVVGAVFLCVSMAASAAPEAVVDRVQLADDLERILQDINTLEALNEGHPNPRLRRRVQDQLGSLRTRVAKMRRQLARAPELGPPPPVEPPPPAAPMAIAPPDFQAFLAELRKTPFSDGKLALIREASLHHHFAVQQVIQVMEVLPQSSDKVDAAAALHPRLVDPQNFFQVYSHIPFSSDQQRLRERVARANPVKQLH